MPSEVRAIVSADHSRSLCRNRRRPLELTIDVFNSDLLSEILQERRNSRTHKVRRVISALKESHHSQIRPSWFWISARGNSRLPRFGSYPMTAGPLWPSEQSELRATMTTSLSEWSLLPFSWYGMRRQSALADRAFCPHSVFLLQHGRPTITTSRIDQEVIQRVPRVKKGPSA